MFLLNVGFTRENYEELVKYVQTQTVFLIISFILILGLSAFCAYMFLKNKKYRK